MSCGGPTMSRSAGAGEGVGVNVTGVAVTFSQGVLNVAVFCGMPEAMATTW